MSKAEALVLIARLLATADDLRDVMWDGNMPQHVVQATADHIKAINEAAEELRRIHKVTA